MMEDARLQQSRRAGRLYLALQDVCAAGGGQLACAFSQALLQIAGPGRMGCNAGHDVLLEALDLALMMKHTLLCLSII